MVRFSIISAFVVIFVLSIVNLCVAFDADSSRIIPSEKVTIYQDGKIIGEYTQEAPLPLGYLLSCKGKCGIKYDNLSMVADDRSLFSFDTQSNGTRSNDHLINVKEGILYFRLSSLPGSIFITTPGGAASMNQLLLNASTESQFVEGYIQINAESSEIGVIKGGSIKFVTNNGQAMVKPGNRLILAMAQIDNKTDSEKNNKKDAKDEDDDNRKLGWYIAGGGAAAAVGIWALNDDHHHNNNASPAQP